MKLATRNGMIDLRDPESYTFDPVEISISLGRIVRFGGHTKRPITVAEHSVRVSQFATRLGECPISALVHDAAEAFFGDIPTPIKSSAQIEAEGKVLRAITDQWGIEYKYPKTSDALALYLESVIESDSWTWAKCPVENPELYLPDYTPRTQWLESVRECL